VSDLITGKTIKVPPRGITFWVPNQGLLRLQVRVIEIRFRCQAACCVGLALLIRRTLLLGLTRVADPAYSSTLAAYLRRAVVGASRPARLALPKERLHAKRVSEVGGLSILNPTLYPPRLCRYVCVYM